MLLTMQAFHTRLFSARGLDTYLTALARLTRARLAHMAAFDSDLSWVAW